MMAYNFYQMLTVLIMLVRMMESRDIIVRKGCRDFKDCGTKDHPCGQIQYALANVANNFDTIYIDGGCDSYSYQIDEPLIINKIITLTALNTDFVCNYPWIEGIKGSANEILILLSPNITISNLRFNGTGRSIYSISSIYIPLSADFIDCSFHGIDLSNSNGAKYYNAEIKFRKCTWSNVIDSPQREYVSRPLLTTKQCKIQILESSIHSSTIKLSFFIKDQPLILVKDSFINHSSIESTEFKGTIVFDDITFDSSSMDVYQMNVYIYNSNFITDHGYVGLGFIESNVSMVNVTTSFSSQINLSFLGQVNITVSNMTIIDSKNSEIYSRLSMMYMVNSTDGGILYSTINNQMCFNDNELTIRDLSLTYYCMPGYLPKYVIFPSSLAFYCIPLSSTKYSLLESKITWNKTNYNFISHTPGISDCPFEGQCANGVIESKEYHWGHVSQNGNYENTIVKFLTCPELYCLRNQKLVMVNGGGSHMSCAGNKEGYLCGDCIDGYTLQVMGQHMCVHCNDNSFWFFYVAMIVLLLIIYAYFKRILIYTISKQRQERKDENNEHRNQPQENDEKQYLFGNRRYPQQMQNFHEEPEVAGAEKNRKLVLLNLPGLLEIIFTFYQIVYIMRIRSQFKLYVSETISSAIDFILVPFTLTLDIVNSKIFECAAFTTNASLNELIKIGPCLSYPMMVLLVFLLLKAVNSLKKYCQLRDRNQDPIVEMDVRIYQIITEDVAHFEVDTKPIHLRLKEIYLSLLLTCYLPMTVFFIKISRCISIDDASHQFIQGSVACYSSGQTAAIFCIILWSLPFSFSLYIATNLLKNCKVTSNYFLAMVSFPPLVFWYFLVTKHYNRHQLNADDAASAYHLLHIINQPFRSYQNRDQHPKNLQWHSNICFFSLLFAFISQIVTYPVMKILLLGFLLCLFIILTVLYQPYTSKKLNTMNMSTLIVLLLLIPINLFWAMTGFFEPSNNLFWNTAGLSVLTIELCLVLYPLAFLFLFIIFSFAKIVLLATGIDKYE